MKTTAEKLMSHVDVADSGCWLWNASTAHNGYGQIGLDKRTRSAHTVAYETWVGPIPAEHQIDHTCHNGTDCAGGKTCAHRRCINPAHLEAVTRRVNVGRSHNLGAKTHCLRGHELAGANLRVNGRGARSCLRCRDEARAAEREAREKARVDAGLLTVAEVAAYFKVHPSQVTVMLNKGELVGFHNGPKGTWYIPVENVRGYVADAERRAAA